MLKVCKNTSFWSEAQNLTEKSEQSSENIEADARREFLIAKEKNPAILVADMQFTFHQRNSRANIYLTHSHTFHAARFIAQAIRGLNLAGIIEDSVTACTINSFSEPTNAEKHHVYFNFTPSFDKKTFIEKLQAFLTPEKKAYLINRYCPDYDSSITLTNK